MFQNENKTVENKNTSSVTQQSFEEEEMSKDPSDFCLMHLLDASVTTDKLGVLHLKMHFTTLVSSTQWTFVLQKS